MHVFVALTLLFGADKKLKDEPTLVAPTKKPKVPFGVGIHPEGEPGSEPAVAVDEIERRRLGLLIAPELLGHLVIAPDMGGGVGVGVEVGYRFAPAHGLIGLSLDPQFAAGWFGEALSAGPASGRVLRFRLPLLLTVNVESRLGMFRAALGPSFHWFSRQVEGVAQGTRDTGSGLGGTLMFAYVFAVPVGFVGPELRYHLAPTAARGTARLEHTLEMALSWTIQL